MPKNKSHKGLLKRVRVTKTGKVKHRSANHKHLRSGKGGKRLRQLRKDSMMSNADAKRLEKLLFRRLRGRDQSRAALRSSPSPAQSAERKVLNAALKKKALGTGPGGKSIPDPRVKTTKITKTAKTAKTAKAAPKAKKTVKAGA